MVASRHWGRLVAAGLITLATSVVGAPAALADTGPPITVSPSPIILDGRAGNARVANQTGLRLILEFAVVDPTGTPVAATLRFRGGSASSGQVVLEPAATMSVALDMARRDDTQLVVQVHPVASALATGSVTRVPIKTTAAATPAVASWTSIATYQPSLPELRLEDPSFDGSGSIPLDGTCAGLGLGSSVGVLQTNGRAVTVAANCPVPDSHAVDVTYGSLDWNGWESTTYTGAVDLTPADDNSGEVSLTLVTTLANWVIWLAVALALLLAIVAERLTKSWRQKSWLKADLKDVRGSLAGVDARFLGLAKELGLHLDEKWQVAAGLGAEAAKLGKGLTSADDQAALQAVTDRVATLRQTIVAWQKLPEQLRALQDCLARLGSVPLIRDAAARLVDPPDASWSSTAMAARILKVTSSIAFAAEWPAESLSALRKGLEEVGEADAPVVKGLFDALAVENDQHRARLMVQDLAPYFAELARAATRSDLVESVGPPVPSGLPAVPGPLEVISLATQARLIRLRVAVVDWVLLVVAVLAVYALGVTQLLKGTAFFGWREVLAAFTWAFAAGSVLGPISEGLVRVGQSATRLKTPAAL